MEMLVSIMPIMIISFLGLNLVLLIWSIVDLVKRDDSEVTGNNKILWILIILFLSVLGPILYLVLGRKPKEKRA